VKGMITWQDRHREWKALLDYCSENRQALEASGRMKALVICLQSHWQDKMRLKAENNGS